MKARRIQYNESGLDQTRVDEFLRNQYGEKIPIPPEHLHKALLNDGKRRDTFVIEDFNRLKAVVVVDALPSEANVPAEVILFVSDQSFMEVPAGKDHEHLEKLSDNVGRMLWEKLIPEFHLHYGKRPVQVSLGVLEPRDARGLNIVKGIEPFCVVELP